MKALSVGTKPDGLLRDRLQGDFFSSGQILKYSNIIRPSRILQLVYRASGCSNSLSQFEYRRSSLC